MPAYRLLRVRDARAARTRCRFVGRERGASPSARCMASVRDRAALPARHGRRRRRGREDRDSSPRRSSLVGGARRARPLPPLRRGNHLLAGRRGAQAARRAAVRTDAAAAAIRSLLGETEHGDLGGRDRLGVPQDARAAAARGRSSSSSTTSTGARARSSISSSDVALLSSGAPILLLCLAPARAARAPSGLAGHASPRAAAGRRTWRALIPDTHPPSRCASRSRARRAATRSSSSEMLAMAGEATARWSFRRRSRRSWRPASTSSTRPSEPCSSAARSRARSSTAAPSRRCARRERRSTPRLAALVRKELIRPDRPSSRRGRLPFPPPPDPRRRLRRAPESRPGPSCTSGSPTGSKSHGTELVELDELLGYHLEQAARYRQRASGRGERRPRARRPARPPHHRRSAIASAVDFGSTTDLLQRAADLAPAAELDLGLETDLIDALTGTTIDEALGRARSVSERSAAAGDRVGELCGRIHEAVRISVEPVSAADAWRRSSSRRCRSSRPPVTISRCASPTARWARAPTCAPRSTRSAARTSKPGLPGPAGGTALVGYQSHARFHGSTPVTELLAWQDEQDPRERRGLLAAVIGALSRSRCSAVRRGAGSPRRAPRRVVERGGAGRAAAVEGYASTSSCWAGDPGRRRGREDGCRIARSSAAGSELSTTAGGLARVCRARPLDDAERWACAPPSSAPRRRHHARCSGVTRGHWCAHVAASTPAGGAARGRGGADRGDDRGPERPKARRTRDLGQVLALAGRPEDAADASEEALRPLCEAKENLVMARASARTARRAPSRGRLVLEAAEHDASRCGRRSRTSSRRRCGRRPRAPRSGCSRGRTRDPGLVVDRRRQHAVARSPRIAEHRLDRAGGAEAVAGRALRRGDRRVARVLLAERQLDHARLGRVAERRRGAVRVDVVDLVRLDPRRRRTPSSSRGPGSRPSGSGSVMWRASEETP